MNSSHRLGRYASACLALPLLVTPAVGRATAPEPNRAAIVIYLADRTTRDLEALIAEWQVASGGVLQELTLEIATLAVERRGYMVEAFQLKPEDALALVLTPADRAIVDSIIPGQTAQPATLSGTVNIYVDEDFTLGGSSFSYMLFEDISQYELNLRSGEETLRNLEGGSSVQVSGYLLDDEFAFDGAGTSVSLVSSAPRLPIGPVNYLTVIAKFPGTADPAYDYSVLEAIYETNTRSVQAYYDENSYAVNQVIADTTTIESALGSVLTLTIPVTADTKLIRDEIVRVIETTPTIDLNDYYGLAMYFDWSGANPPSPYFNRATVGLTRVPSSQPNTAPYQLAVLWMGGGNSVTSEYSNVHEVGHTLGLNHSGFLAIDPLTNGGVYSQSNVCEYGNPISVMGSGNAGTSTCNALRNGSAHVPAMQKVEIGSWIDQATEVLTYSGTNGNETHTLRPVSYSTPGLAFIRVPRLNMGALFIEFRHPGGGIYETAYELFNVNAVPGSEPKPGALLYVRPSPRYSALLDPAWVPGQDPVASRSLLLEGGSFTDPCSDVTVTIDQITTPSPGVAPSMTVSLASSGGCGHLASPTVSFSTPSVGSILPYSGEQVVLRAAGWADPTQVVFDLHGQYPGSDDPPIYLGQGTLDSASGDVTFPPISWTSTFKRGPVRLVATMSETPVNCCPYTKTAYRNIRIALIAPADGPTTAVQQPTDSATVSTPFSVAASAVDEDGVADVEFWFDPLFADTCGVPESFNGVHPSNCKYHAFFPAFSRNFPSAGVDRGGFLLDVAMTGPPYSCSVGFLPPGTYSIWARAHNNGGTEAVSDPITVMVSGQVAFDVELAIDGGTAVPAGQSITIPAVVDADAGEIGYVDYFIDGQLLERIEESPFECTWQVPASPGTSYVIRADAWGIGGRTDSDATTVVSSGS